MMDVARAAADSPPPSRRRGLRKEDILIEAARLFAERGYDGASMSDLAERVGLRKASLFHHFESKDTLYGAVLSRLVAVARANIATATTASGSYAARLDALTDAIASMLITEPFAARLLLREAMDAGCVTRDPLGAAIDEVYGAFIEFTKAGQSAGEFRPDLDPAHLMVSLAGIWCLPFAIDRAMERMAGRPFEELFVEELRHALRSQVRTLVLVYPA